MDKWQNKYMVLLSGEQVDTANHRKRLTVMAVRTKNRRKLIYDGKLYVWYVKPDEDVYDKLVLSIISWDKSLILAYPIENPVSYAVSKGLVFQGKMTDGRWKRYLSPVLNQDAVTPAFVSELIAWAVDGSDAVEIKWDGNRIWL